MICSKKTLRSLLSASIFYLLPCTLLGQIDTLPKAFVTDSIIRPFKGDTAQRMSLDEYMKSRKGFLGNMVKNLRRDTTDVQKANDLQRNDVLYKIYEGAIIRRITIQDLPFGTPLSDTSKKVV